jgi:type IV secretion system protein VirB3
VIGDGRSGRNNKKDPLFLAVTRPALWAGVPIEAGASASSWRAQSRWLVRAILSTAARPPSRYAMARLIVRHDVNAFRLIFLWGRTKAANRNRVFWVDRARPRRSAGIKRKGFGRGVR